ncbi:kiwellin-like [Solanum verrucosum]|uniref:kiwellin-like n=1 Tax=Solanum verrucosum TaxID=315347 RepID=UPI0020D1162F|nr:kiwellin-like [Solanum verrucosum]
MSNLAFLSLIFTIFIYTYNAISLCNGPCKTWDDCDGQLICINGKCNDDPNGGTKICQSSPPSVPSPTPTNTCRPSSTVNCNGVHPIYRCSPHVTSSMPAQVTFNDFSKGGDFARCYRDGGGPSSCDGKYHNNNERIVALSIGWFPGRSRCGKMILIRSNNEKTVTAKVVDECDSTMGCDAEHAFQSPCKNNIVDGSITVWRALGLDTNLGIVPVTWSMV